MTFMLRCQTKKTLVTVNKNASLSWQMHRRSCVLTDTFIELQLVKEVRHIYSFAVIETATRLGRLVFERAGDMNDIIWHTSQTVAPLFQGYQQHRGHPVPAPHATPIACLQQTLDGFLTGIRSVLEDKAFIALTRGLWDFLGNEAFCCLDTLADGRENPVRLCQGNCHQNSVIFYML